MARIEIKTLVLAFEKRIEALEKNPPDKVPTAVIINMLEGSIDEIIKNHFMELIKMELSTRIKSEFAEMHDKFVKKTIKNILSDEDYRGNLENKLKSRMITSIREMVS